MYFAGTGQLTGNFSEENRTEKLGGRASHAKEYQPSYRERRSKARQRLII